MNFKKWGVVLAAGALAASLALFGCSSNGGASDQKGTDQKADDTATAETYTLTKDGSFIVATSPDFPPFENLIPGTDEAEGFDIDLGKAIADELGLTFEMKPIQFDGILTAVAAGGQADVGISGITVDPERAQTVDFSDAYYTDNQAIAVLKGGAITSDNAKEELNKEGVIIAVQSGTTGETYCQENFPNATVQPYGNSTEAFAAMNAERVNAVCTNSAVVTKMLSEAYTDAEIVMQVATGEDYAVAVSKDNPKLLEAVNGAIKTLTENGTIDELTTKWLG